MEATDVRLVAETLDLEILSLHEVQVRADYVLDNPGEKAVVRFSVPVTSGGRDGGRPSAAAASVRLTDAGGEFVPCLVKPRPTPLTLPVPSAVGANVVDQHCTADLVVQPGVSTVRLSYEGELVHEDPQDGGGIPASDRTLVFLLGGGAAWKGRPDQLDITLTLGPFASSATVRSPEKSRREGPIVSWSIDRPDHAKLGALRVDLGGAAPVRASRVHDLHDTKLGASVHEVLADGDPSTTRCGPATRVRFESAPACPPTVWMTPAVDVDIVECETRAALKGATSSQPGAGSVALTAASTCFEVRPAAEACLGELAVASTPCEPVPAAPVTPGR
ncbi:MAG: hypothetical protein KC656_25050 [Myxococcales bacterium]|nr:hypothetical protein [Myxococcales bacterium]